MTSPESKETMLTAYCPIHGIVISTNSGDVIQGVVDRHHRDCNKKVEVVPHAEYVKMGSKILSYVKEK